MRTKGVVGSQDLIHPPFVEKFGVKECQARLIQKAQPRPSDGSARFGPAGGDAVVDHVGKWKDALDPSAAAAVGEVRVAPNDLVVPLDALGRKDVRDGAHLPGRGDQAAKAAGETGKE